MVAALKQRLKNAIAEGGWSAGWTIGMWFYWAVYSLVAPVTFFDSQTYNLARLEIFKAGGFWKNNIWNTERQISFPWTFDALHLPFLRIGTGTSLPSFACFTGLLWIIHRLVSKHYTARTAWLCCLSLMAMPMMVYQATSSKNDLVIVFTLACWFYALLEFKRTRRPLHLWAMAASLGLAAGSKTSGIPLVLIAGLVSLWQLRHDFRSLRIFAASSVLSIVLLGSIETYINNQLTFGRPLGSEGFIDWHQNHEGLRGMSANFIRYLVGNATTGIEPTAIGKKITVTEADFCRTTLHSLGLADAGSRRDFKDDSLAFSHSSHEGSADFGPIGTLALLAVFYALISFRRRDRIIVTLASISLLTLLIVSHTTAWMPWNNRFLVLTVASCAVTLMIIVGQHAPRFLYRGILIIAMMGAVYPLFASFNRKPEHIKDAFTRRLHYSLKENPGLYEVIHDVETRVASGECQHLVLHVGIDSWTLPFFSIHPMVVHPEPQLTSEMLLRPAYKNSHLLVLNRVVPAEIDHYLTLVKDYDEPHATLYRITQ